MRHRWLIILWVSHAFAGLPSANPLGLAMTSESPGGGDAATSLEKPPTLRAEQRAYTQRRLMEAGLEVFHEHGYTQASIDQVVTAAGASRATFYLHFKSKAKLMERVIAARQSEVMELYDAFSGIRSRADLRSWLAEVLTFAGADRGRYINVLSQAAQAEQVDRPDAGHDLRRLHRRDHCRPFPVLSRGGGRAAPCALTDSPTRAAVLLLAGARLEPRLRRDARRPDRCVGRGLAALLPHDG